MLHFALPEAVTLQLLFPFKQRRPRSAPGPALPLPGSSPSPPPPPSARPSARPRLPLAAVNDAAFRRGRPPRVRGRCGAVGRPASGPSGGARGLAGSKRGRLELPAAAVAVETVPAARGPEACNGGSR